VGRAARPAMRACPSRSATPTSKRASTGSRRCSSEGSRGRMSLAAARARRMAPLVALVLLAPAARAAGTAAVDACKLLKVRELRNVLDQPVARPEKSRTSKVIATCEWQVSATANKPDGSVSTFLQFVGAKISFDTNR